MIRWHQVTAKNRGKSLVRSFFMEIFNDFFGNDVKKEIELLHFLYHQKRFVTIEEMSQALNMDRRSIYKYYDVLSNHSLMTDESREPIFHIKHGLGYKFTGTKTDYKTVIRKILQENPFFNLFETLLLENEVNLVKFAYENYLSESTVRKRSYELETLLQPLGFTVKKNKGTLYLVGDEPRIRYFMVAFFWKNFSGLHWPFPGISQQKCEMLARHFYEINEIPFNDIELKITTYVLAVTIIRFRKGKKITSEMITLAPDLPPKDQEIFQQLTDQHSSLLKKLTDELSEHFLLETMESHFIFLWLRSNLDLTFSKEQLADYFDIQEESVQNRSYLQAIIHLLLKDTDSQQLSTRKKNLILRTILSGILSVELFGETIHTLTGYNLQHYVSQNFPNLLMRSEQLLDQIDLYSSSDSKRKGLALHVAVAWTLVSPPSTFMKKINLKLETDLPLALSLTIKERIESSFQSYYHLDIRSHFENEDYDLCLSTAPLTESFETVPVLLINAQVTLADLLAIKQVLEELV